MYRGKGKKDSHTRKMIWSVAVLWMTTLKAGSKMIVESGPPCLMLVLSRLEKGHVRALKMSLSVAMGLAFPILGMGQKVKYYQLGTKSVLQTGKYIFGSATAQSRKPR